MGRRVELLGRLFDAGTLTPGIGAALMIQAMADDQTELSGRPPKTVSSKRALAMLREATVSKPRRNSTRRRKKRRK